MFEKQWLQGENRRDTEWYREDFQRRRRCFWGAVQLAQRTREEIVNTFLKQFGCLHGHDNGLLLGISFAVAKPPDGAFLDRALWLSHLQQP